jgi:hypothetical protein
MPNGHEYNQGWCDERHKKIGEEFHAVWEKIRIVDNRLWAVLVLLIANLGGVIALFFKG